MDIKSLLMARKLGGYVGDGNYLHSKLIAQKLGGGSGGNTGGGGVNYTHALYNGVRLPKIPEDVLAEYPYAWIRKNTSSGEYQLILSTTGFYLTGNTLDDKNGANNPKYVFPIGETPQIAWTEASDSFGYNAWGIDSARPCMWSNHDIPNGSATATEIYFEGTDPVPTA